MSENDSRMRFAAAATKSNPLQTKPLLLVGVVLVVLLAVGWLVFGGGESKVASSKGLDEIQRESYERRITALKEEIDELAAENQRLESALLKAESDLLVFKERLRKENRTRRVVE